MVPQGLAKAVLGVLPGREGRQARSVFAFARFAVAGAKMPMA